MNLYSQVLNTHWSDQSTVTCKLYKYISNLQTLYMLFFSFYKGVCIIIFQHERREIMTSKFFNALLSSLHIFSSVKCTWYTITYVYAYMLTDQIPCWRYRRNLQCISRFHLKPLTTHHARMRLIITLHSKTCTVHMQ